MIAPEKKTVQVTEGTDLNNDWVAYAKSSTVEDCRLQGRNMVYPGPIDPYFLALILIPEPHFPQNFDPWAMIKELIPSMFLHKILSQATLFISNYRI